MKLLIFLVLSLSTASALAKPIRVLFVGNSLTFMPEWKNPTVPSFVKNLLNEKHIEHHIDTILEGGHTLENHWKRFEETVNGKPDGYYDFVFIQPYSIEALELPVCFRDQGPFAADHKGPQGREHFLDYGSRMIELVRAKKSLPIVIQPWTYNATHPWLQASFECAKFPGTNESWYGGSMDEYQRRLDEGYNLLKAKTGVQVLRIGRLWNVLRKKKYAKLSLSAFYQADQYHPTYLGALLSAMIITQRVTNIKPDQFKYCPSEVAPEQAEAIEQLVKENQQITFEYPQTSQAD